MPRRRNLTDFKNTQIVADDLDSYDIVTLYSLKKVLDGNFRILFTKGGGLWPILLARIYENYEITSEDLRQPLNRVFNLIEKYPFEYVIMPPKPNFVIETFVSALLEEKDSYGYLSKAVMDYQNTLIKLEAKSLIEDPYQGNTVMITENMTETSNKLTEQGIQTIQRVYSYIEHEVKLYPEQYPFKHIIIISNLIDFFVSFILERFPSYYSV